MPIPDKKDVDTNVMLLTLAFPQRLFFMDDGTVLISYKKSLTQPRMVFTERSLYKTIKLFFDYIMRFETN